jgi:hypothetical protein
MVRVSLRLTFALISLFAWTGVFPGPVLASESAQTSSLKPAKLRCEYLVNPMVIDVVRPRLSWIVETSDPTRRGSDNRHTRSSPPIHLKNSRQVTPICGTPA